VRRTCIAALTVLAAAGCARSDFVSGQDGERSGDGAASSWRSLGPKYWPALQQRLRDAADQGSTAAATVREISNAALAAQPDDRFQGVVLAPNGRIYGVPRMASQIVELDPLATGDPVVSLLGPVLGGADKWYGAALAWDGNIYCSTSDYNFPLRIDPEDVTGSAEVTTVDLSSSLDKWVGLRVVPSGKLLACPRNDEHVLEIDLDAPSGVQVRRVGPSLGTASYKWWSGVLAPNGNIYCIPQNDAQILEINPEDLTATGIRRVGPDLGVGVEKWRGATLAPSGRFYAAPSGDTHVLEIVPDDINSSGRVGPDFGTMSRKWEIGTLAPNGKIYAVPGRATQVLEIDPQDHSALSGIRPVGLVMRQTPLSKYFGATLAPNGKIYALPWQGATEILEVDPHASASFDLDVLLNGHLNGQ